MTSKFCRFVCCGSFCLALGIGCLPQSAAALDTPNVLMTIDGMTLMHSGLFRNNTPNDGFGTFQFGPTAEAVGSLNRFKSVYFVKTGAGDGGRSHNSRMHSDSPEIWTGSAFTPYSSTLIGLDSDVFPIIDRATGGQLFDPAEYQIEVKFKPNMGVAGVPNNTAPLFTIGLDQVDGMVWDAEAGRYKRGNDAFTYNIGSGGGDFNSDGNVDAADYVVWRKNDVANAPLPNDAGLTTQGGRYGLWRSNFGKQTINVWYENAPKDADGFATWTVPVTSPNFVQRGFYYNFFNGGETDRQAEAITGNGRVFNDTTMVWGDVNDGLDTLSFGGGAVDPGNPGGQLRLPNGVPLMSIGAPNAEAGLSIELKYAALKRITPGPIVARIDENSGISYRFGSALTYGPNLPPITVDGVAVSPNATDQISRFDDSGMTNLVINAREPDVGEGPFRGYQYRFNVRTAPSAESFDGSDPNVMMNIRAKLLPTNTATSMTITAKDLDGSDCSLVNLAFGCRAVDTVGADEYTYALDLSQFNSSTFTTVSVPLNSFTLSMFTPPTTTNPADPLHKDSLGPFGFAHPGDGLLSDFNLYEFGAGVVAGAGLLRMEIDFMEIRLPDSAGSIAGVVPEPAAWLMMSIAAAWFGLGRRRVH
ncbi:MAG: PEP-CTERM sorting domain-containing protein [Verrucomicrobia subdivision 3 bacterium]|nr:PEP-CTERM sorting domain-containing protein [Limisphaerales bacterium]